jgi:phage terminase small subunit
MPRLAAAAQSFTATSTARPVLRPPSDLNELEREEFANIVLGVGPHHFVPVDVALIAILAKNIVLERIAFGELRAAGYVSDRPSPWLAILQHATKEVRATSRTLSLTPASRQPAKPEELEPVSYYERMSLLEGRRDDEPH